MIEYADQRRIDPDRSGPFPKRWGPVPSDPDERRRWIAFNARREETRSKHRAAHEARARVLDLRREVNWNA